MSSPPLKYYSSLPPFRVYFRGGTPILTYHKVGPRPSGALLKFLYVSPRLFSRQMCELRNAGFTSVPLDRIAEQTRERRIVITFDDGFRNVLEHAVQPLADAGFRAIQFIVPGFIGKNNAWDLPKGEVAEPLMDRAGITDWLAAGHAIGAHTLTHPDLRRISKAAAREEISASKKQLEDMFGEPVRHFCYPYGSWNPDLAKVVEEAGYETACTTECGINDRATSPFGLRRLTARYPSRNARDTLVRLFVPLLNRFR